MPKDPPQSLSDHIRNLAMRDNPLSENVRNQIKDWVADNTVERSGELVPPWVWKPDMPRESIGWRMGGGEDYLSALGGWIRDLQETDFIEYRRRFPEPEAWSGFYDEVRSSTKGL
ncbi:MAG: hypothetical protein AAF626_04115 [Pseudomonadota bacterium]